MGRPEPVGRQRTPVNVSRTDQRLMVSVPMLGLMPADVHIEITADGRLVLEGELRGTLQGGETVVDKEVSADEWHVGSYHRELELPNPVDGEHGTVTYGNGVVLVALPLSEQAGPAKLRLERAGPEHGLRVGNSGRPVEPLSTDAFRGARSGSRPNTAAAPGHMQARTA